MTKKDAYSERNTYLEKVEAQLKEWSAEIETLKAEASKVKPAARITYDIQLRVLTDKQEAVQRKLQELSLAGKQSWEELRAQVENALTELKEELIRVNELAKKARYEVLSWARGIASEHVVESIGWAQGIAEEDPVESIGWAQGVAEEDPVESIGWAQGYGQEKKKA